MTIRVKTPDGGTAEFPDETPIPQIEAAMREKFGAPQGMHAAAAGAETIGAAPWYAKPMFAGHGPSVLQALEALPAAGGIIGGMVGGGAGIPTGPGALATTTAGAALGGAGGESLRQLARTAIGATVPPTALERAKGVGEEAPSRAGLRRLADYSGKGLSAGSARLMQSAVKPPAQDGEGCTQDRSDASR